MAINIGEKSWLSGVRRVAMFQDCKLGSLHRSKLKELIADITSLIGNIETLPCSSVTSMPGPMLSESCKMAILSSVLVFDDTPIFP
jgi:hypothetical protein